MATCHVISVIAEKGGVGKTTIALTLAVAALQAGFKVSVFDLDPQATATQWTDRREAEFPWVVAIPSTRLVASLEAAKKQGVNFVVVDTPPHAGSTSVEAVRYSDLTIIPVEPHLYTIETLPKINDILRLAGDLPALFLISKAATQGKEGVDAATYIANMGFNVCPVILYLRAAHRHAGNVGMTAQEYEPKGKAAEESQQVYMYTYKLLTTEKSANG